jgi:predicted nucleotidyltransferase
MISAPSIISAHSTLRWRWREPGDNCVSDLNQLIQRLCDAGIDFVIVGGFAATLHGSSLVTRDLDVCAVLSSENVEKLREALRDLRPAHRFTPQNLSFLEIPEPGVPMLNLYLRTEIGPIDVLGSILGIGEFERVRAGAIEIELFGRHCLVISLDDLIRAKEAVGREKDLLAVKELKAIREKQAKA